MVAGVKLPGIGGLFKILSAFREPSFCGPCGPCTSYNLKRTIDKQVTKQDNIEQGITPSYLEIKGPEGIRKKKDKLKVFNTNGINL